MKQPKNVRLIVIALAGVVLLAAGGWIAARQIKSPAQVAADAAAPKPSLVTAEVQRRGLSSQVIVRGTGRYGRPQAISLPTSSLKASTQVISQIARPDQVLRERSIALTVSGRPVFVLQGSTPMHRDIGPGDSGRDVLQLEQALSRFGLRPGAVDGAYDGATAAAVAQLYRDRDAAPFGLTEAQIDRLNTASALVGTATENMLQQRLALRTAQRGATRGEVNQAKIDAATVAELIPPARAAAVGARTRIAEARDLATIAKRLAASGDGAAARDVATAQVEVTVKQGALNDAVAAQAEAQRATQNSEASPAERAAAQGAANAATARVPSARAELAAAEAAKRAAENVLSESKTKARDDGRKAARDLALAQSDLREAQRTIVTLEGKHRLALTRVRILERPVSTVVEREIVAAAAGEMQRASSDYARLAARSGVQVPADEILFFANTPVRVDSVAATRGSQATGDLMTISNTTLAIDSGLSPQDAKLVRTGMRVRIEDPETGIDLRGRVTRIADRPGTNQRLGDPTKTAFEVTPEGANERLVNTSVRLAIAIKSTRGEVLTVPLNALSVGADGESRVQVDNGGGRTRIVLVDPGLAAAGDVEVVPKRPGTLKEGDRVVIGSGSAFAPKAPTASRAPVAPPGVSTTPSAAAPPGTTTEPSTTVPATPPTTTTTPAAPPPAATTPAPGPDEGPAGPAEPQGGFRGP